MREVIEEAGVRGDVGHELGVLRDVSKSSYTAWFTILVDTVIPEDAAEGWTAEETKVGPRRREWFSIDAAAEAVAWKEGLSALVNYAAERLLEGKKSKTPPKVLIRRGLLLCHF